jgi:hypothetical protein
VLKGWGWTSSLSVTDDGEYYGLLRSRKKKRGHYTERERDGHFQILWKGIIV